MIYQSNTPERAFPYVVKGAVPPSIFRETYRGNRLPRFNPSTAKRQRQYPGELGVMDCDGKHVTANNVQAGFSGKGEQLVLCRFLGIVLRCQSGVQRHVEGAEKGNAEILVLLCPEAAA